MKKRYQIFISSTYKDLKVKRQMIMDNMKKHLTDKTQHNFSKFFDNAFDKKSEV